MRKVRKVNWLLVLLLTVVMAGEAFAAGNAPQPTIYSRAYWGARTSWGFGTTGTWNRCTIHHTANQGDYWISSVSEACARIRGTQSYHMDVLGWSDIGYHFLVDKWGNSYEGLYNSLYSTNARGAHDAINASSMGVSMLGWFDSGYNGVPPSAMRQGVYELIAWRMPDPFTGYGASWYGGYYVGYLIGHYHVSSKTCPGNQMQPYVGSDWYGGEARNTINQLITGGAAWQATYVSNTFPPTVAPGEEVTITVTYENSGTQTWNNWTRFATSNPRGRSSSFYLASNWVSQDRPTELDQTSVGPGQQGSFTFIAKAPSTPGSYQEHFELVQDGVSWFEGGGDNVTWYVDVVAPPDWDSDYVANTFPAQVNAGQEVTVSVTFKNTGAQTWDSNTRLGTSNPKDRNSPFYNSSDWLGANRATAVDSSTAPNANGTFTFVAKAPTTPGNYVEHFQLLQEGITWFPDDAGSSVIWYVEVLPDDPPAAPTGVAGTPANQQSIITWNANGESDLAGYNVYRAEFNQGYSQLNGSLLTATNYADNSAVNGTAYIYKVKAQDTGAQLSEYSAATLVIPHASDYIKLQAEDYDLGGPNVGYQDLTSGNTGGAYRYDNVDIATAGDTKFVGWIDTGEWLRFSKIQGNGGAYTAKARVASAVSGGALTVKVNGATAINSAAIPNTGGWETFTELSLPGLSIPDDAQIELYMASGSFNIDWIEFVAETDKVIDNDDGAPGYTETGTWSQSSSTGYDGGIYRYAWTGESKTATWNLNAAVAGTYKVEVFYRAGTNRATSTKYTVATSGGNQNVYINQQQNSLQWVSLGNFSLPAGGGSVTLDAAGSSGGSVVISDAVRITYLP